MGLAVRDALSGVRVHVQPVGELVPVVELHLGEGVKVEVEALEVDDQVGRQLRDLLPLGGGVRLPHGFALSVQLLGVPAVLDLLGCHDLAQTLLHR